MALRGISLLEMPSEGHIFLCRLLFSVMQNERVGAEVIVIKYSQNTSGVVK